MRLSNNLQNKVLSNMHYKDQLVSVGFQEQSSPELTNTGKLTGQDVLEESKVAMTS